MMRVDEVGNRKLMVLLLPDLLNVIKLKDFQDNITTSSIGECSDKGKPN